MFPRPSSSTPRETHLSNPFCFQAICCHPAIASPETTVMAAIAQIQKMGLAAASSTQANCLLVVENEKIVGIATAGDLLGAIPRDRCTDKTPKIGQIASHPVIVLQKSAFTHVKIALDLFQQHRIGHLPIVDEGDRLLGLVTRESLLNVLYTSDPHQKPEIALNDSERRFRDLFASIPQIAVQGYNRHRKTIYWNQASEELYGYTRAEAMGQALEDLIIPPDIRGQNIEAINAWIAGGQPIPAGELQLMRKNGDRVEVFSSHVMLTNARGEPEMYCVDIDLSDRKSVERALQYSESQNQAVLTAIPDLMFCVGIDGIFRSFVTQHRELSIIPPDCTVIGRAMTEVLAADHAARQWHYLHQALQTGELQIYEQQLQVGDRLLDEEVRVVKSGPDEALFMIRDISDRKHAERQLQNLIAGTATTTGGDFFPALVGHIAATLNVSYALVSERIEDKLCILAFWAKDCLQTPHTYPFANIACERVLQDGCLTCQSLSSQQLPEEFRGLNISSYLGVALQDNQGNAIGNLCILDEQPIQNPERAEQVLRVFAARAAAELERQRASTLSARLNQALEAKVAERTVALRAIIEAIPDLLLRVKRDGTCLDYIQSRDLAGEFLPIRKHLSEVLSPELLQQQLLHIDRAIATGKLQIYEHQFSKNDRPVYEEVRISALSKDEVLIVVRDITDRKQDEENLRQLSARLNLALESGGLGIWDWDIVQNQLVWDERMYKLYGIDPECSTPIYETWFNALHPDDRAAAAAISQQARRGEKDYDTEFRVIHPDGSIHFIKARAIFLRDAAGKALRAIGINWEITDRKLAEAELIRAKEAAEAAARAKSNFLACMSHEIRTPISGTIGMLTLLQATELSQTQRSQVDLAQSSAESLLTLINDILDFSKVDAGKLDLETIEFSLGKLLGDFAKAIAFKAEEKGLELVLDLRDIDRDRVQGDPGRLRQILTNLASNAIKFTERGEILIRCRTEAIDEKLALIASVQDTGIGIPAAKISSLFDVFTQVDASTTRKYGGTGLGLAITKQLCELMGGRMRVQSQLGAGSQFECTISLQPAPSDGGVFPSANISALTVLVVDDNVTNLMTLCGQLQQWGVRVISATNGVKALALCIEKAQKYTDVSPFDLVLIDRQMPVMNGIQLGKRLKDSWPALSLTLMTAINDRDESSFCRDRIFNLRIPKPITPADLLTALASVRNPEAIAPTANPLAILQKREGQANKISYQWPQHTRLLLAEDTKVNQMVVKGLLQKMGLGVDIVVNGLEVLQALENAPSDRPYTLVLMDCQMPEMDGYEASRQIRSGRAGDRNGNITIIAMTANAMKGDREKCLAAGMNDYLAKPIKPQALAQMLAKWP